MVDVASSLRPDSIGGTIGRRFRWSSEVVAQYVRLHQCRDVTGPASVLGVDGVEVREPRLGATIGFDSADSRPVV